MRIKRFECADVRQAIRQIRAELGPDAVILSNRKTANGVEISAAIDYDESWVSAQQEVAPETSAAVHDTPELDPSSLDVVDIDAGAGPRLAPTTLTRPGSMQPVVTDSPAAHNLGGHSLAEVSREISNLRGLVESQLSGLAFGDLARRHPARANAFQRLTGLGVTEEVAREVCERIDPSVTKVADAWRQALGLIAHDVRIFEGDPLSDGGVYALLGPTGVGKTTTVAKLAARFALRHSAADVALITTDTYRIGAHEQLSAFAQIMGIPVRVAHDPADLRSALDHYQDKRLVLIDTAGISQRDIRFAEQAAMIQAGSPQATALLALPATGQYRGLEETVHAFDNTGFGGCVITKTDEAVSLGSVLSIVCKYQIPTAYLTNGQRVPEDISSCRAHLLVTRAVSLAEEARRNQDLWSATPQGGIPAYASH